MMSADFIAEFETESVTKVALSSVKEYIIRAI